MCPPAGKRDLTSGLAGCHFWGFSAPMTFPASHSPSGLRPAVFLDRDGTLMEEVHYCRDPRDVRVIPGITSRLEELRKAGWFAVIITNQSGIGRGIVSPAEYEAVQVELLRQLDGQIDGTYFCPDEPSQASRRRKPDIGMVEEAARDFGIDVRRSWFIGDKPADVECGHRAGMRSILVRSGYGAQHAGCGADFEAEDAAQALEWILNRHIR